MSAVSGVITTETADKAADRANRVSDSEINVSRRTGVWQTVTVTFGRIIIGGRVGT